MDSLPYICAACLHHQDSMDRRCDLCGSFRVVLKSVIPPELLRKVGVQEEVQAPPTTPLFPFYQVWVRQGEHPTIPCRLCGDRTKNG